MLGMVIATEAVGPVVAALIGAGGAVIGGGLTALSTWSLDRARSRREREDREKQRDASVLQAIRIIHDDLLISERQLRQLATSRRWSATSVALQKGSWAAYRATIASNVHWLVWRHLADAFDHLTEIGALAADTRGDDDIDSANLVKLLYCYRIVRIAVDALEHHLALAPEERVMLMTLEEVESRVWPDVADQ